MLRRAMLVSAASLVAIVIAGCGERPPSGGNGKDDYRIRIGVVAKSLGNGFFDAVHKGADEAATTLDAEIIFTGPTTPTAEGQIETLNALIAQRVDAIAISANDPDAVVPTLQRAMKRGIKVISFDSAVAKEGRALHLAPSSDIMIGQTVLDLAAELAPDGKGKFAVVSATPTSTNQNAWLVQMQDYMRMHPCLEYVSVVYGDDVADKSYRETVALLKQHPDLAVIVSLSSVGIVAAAKAVEDQGLTGKVKVTGLGLPSELAGYVRKGVVPKFAIWNPIDLGYATIHVAAQLARGTTPDDGKAISLGRVGSVTFNGDGVGAMAKPFIYDQSNIEQFAAIF